RNAGSSSGAMASPGGEAEEAPAGSPEIRMDPASAGRRPPMVRSRVVLPLALGPTSATHRLGATVRSRLLRIATRPPPTATLRSPRADAVILRPARAARRGP